VKFNKLILCTILIIITFPYIPLCVPSLGNIGNGDDLLLRFGLMLGGEGSYVPPLKPEIGVDFYGPIYFDEDVKRLKSRIENYRSKGVYYFTYNAFDHIENEEAYVRVPNLGSEGVEITLDGELIHGRHAINTRVFRDFLVNVCKKAIDAGSSGVVFDVAYADRYSFDPDSIAGFRGYLASNFDEEYLRENYNITDISTFDYAQYLQDLGYDASKVFQSTYEADFMDWYKPRYHPPLWVEWNDYLREVEVNFLRRLRDELKNYSMTKYGRPFYITANRGWRYDQLISAQYLDFLSGETFIDDMDGYCPYPNITMVPMYKLALSIGKMFWSWNVPTSPNHNRTALFAAETHAYGGIYEIPIDICQYDVESQHYLRTAGKVNELVINHPELFIDQEEDSEVAIVYSLSWAKYDFIGELSFRGACYILSDEHITFDVVLLGDNRWIADDLTLSKIRGYRAVVLPNPLALTDNQVQVMTDYVKDGGTLLIFGNAGIYDEQLNLVNRTEWNSIINIEGVKKYGNGTVVRWGRMFKPLPSGRIAANPDEWLFYPTATITLGADLGAHYHFSLYERDADQVLSDIEYFEEYANQVIDKDIVTDLPRTVHFVRWRNKRDGSITYHVINYNYDFASDSIIPASGEISVPIPKDWKTQFIQVHTLSPESPTPKQLPFNITDDRINLRLDLNLWSIIKISQLKYKEFLDAYHSLRGDYESLVKNYNSLLAELNKTKVRARALTYALLATTVTFIITTVCLLHKWKSLQVQLRAKSKNAF